MGMIPKKGIWNCILTLLVLSSAVDRVFGRYDTPFLVALTDPPRGIDVNPIISILTIEENLMTNDFRIAQIMYTDDSGSGIPPTVTFVPQSPNSPDIEVIYDGRNYYLVLREELDCDPPLNRTKYGILLSPNPPSYIEISVKDMNDNPPYMVDYPTVYLEVDENDIPAEPLFTFKGHDIDTSNIGQLTYLMKDLDVSDQNDSPFTIHTTIGDLRVKAELDFERRTSHRLEISVFDTIHTAAAPMVTNIRVIDFPDTAPRWLTVVSRIRMQENNSSGTWTYSAVDGDRDINSAISYTIIEDPNYPYFEIDPNSGVLSISNPIDAEALESLTFDLRVKAMEVQEPNMFVEEIVSIQIEDVNDKPPLIQPLDVRDNEFIVKVDEHTAGELPIEKDGLTGIVIFDKDVTLANSRYTAKLDVPPEMEFIHDVLSLSPLTGTEETTFTIRIINPLAFDFEDERWRGLGDEAEIEFSVTITPENDPDPMGNTATANIKLQLQDINDQTPDWLDLGEDGALHFSCMETVGIGYPLGTIKAWDKDLAPAFGNDSLRYRWYRNTPSNMDIDAISGVITIKVDNSFDFETNPNEAIYVEVVDMYGTGGIKELKSNVLLNIHLIDVNDVTPTIRIPTSQAKILENSLHTTAILAGIEGRDPDTSANLEFTIEVLSSSPNTTVDLDTWFEIEDISSTPGVWNKTLVVGTGIIDRELLSRVDLNIIVRDIKQEVGISSSSVYLSIEIEDVNDSDPTFTIEYGYENFTIQVTETFEFPVGGDNSTDYEREIITFMATDRDLNEVLTYYISSEYPRMEELVELNETTGVLRRRKGVMIDREENITGEGDTNRLLYTVTVYDNNRTHNAIVDIRIQVSDINDEFPKFVKDYPVLPYDVDENQENVKIEIIEAIDKDAGTYGTVHYFLDESYNNGIGVDKFKINEVTGSLITVGGLDREQVSSYTLQIRGFDNYRPSSTINSNSDITRITIKINDVNDERPEFVSGMILPNKIEGNVMIDEELGEVLVTDKDEEGTANSQVDFELLEIECSNPKVIDSNNFFYIKASDSEKGFKVFANTSFNLAYGIYNLSILATDRGVLPLSNTGNVTIRIVGVNNHDPVFHDNSDLRLYIDVTTDVGSPLRLYNEIEDYPEIEVSDEDDNTTLNGEFRFSLEGEDADYFRLPDDKLGSMILYRRLNLETKPYNFVLRVSDLGQISRSSSKNIAVFAVPVEDHTPIFASLEFKTNITENNEFPIAFAKLYQATDADIINEEVNLYQQRICYYIIEQTNEGFFEINADTNELTVKVKLDREQSNESILIIHAKNDAVDKPCSLGPIIPDPSHLNSNLTVIITVDDVIDTPPKFKTEGLISGGIKVSADNGSPVLTLEADDEDLNDVVRFNISSDVIPSDDSLRAIVTAFNLNSETGLLSIGFQPLSGMKGHFSFSVRATDLGGFSTVAECKVYMVTDAHVVRFTFNNDPEYVGVLKDLLALSLTRVFTDSCTVDNVKAYTDESGNIVTGKTSVDTHFINLGRSEPVLSTSITDKQYDSTVLRNLLDEMDRLNLNFDTVGLPNSQEGEEIDPNEILLYIMIAAVGVVTVTLIIVSVSCWFNSKSLSLRVRALTASTFGSKDSNLNKIGGASELPNTNQHAIEGSNPIWTKDSEANAPRHDFDNESVGSGGSILIGVEDDEDFRNYGGGNGKSNPMFAGEGERDFSQLQSSGINPLFGLDEDLESETEITNETLDLPKPIMNLRRNPLMNIDLSGDSSES